MDLDLRMPKGKELITSASVYRNYSAQQQQESVSGPHQTLDLQAAAVGRRDDGPPTGSSRREY